MLKFRQLVLVSTICCLTNCQTEQNHEEVGLTEEKNRETFKESEFQEIIDSLYHDNPNTKGIIMHIESPDINLSWNGAVGSHHQDSDQPLRPEDPALIASMTKTYVSAAILRLVEEGHFDLKDPIQDLISNKSRNLLIADGYDLKSIKVGNLLSHTSGIFDFVDSPKFQKMTQSEPEHEWTRDEQIAMGIEDGDPIAKSGTTFRYADLNYLLLTEIIENKTKLPYYQAIRELLRYEMFGLNNTWFNLLEPTPEDSRQLIQQFATGYQVESYTLHGSYDLFGGGGIAATAEDVAHFSQYLFNGDLFNDAKTINLIYTETKTQDSIPSDYYMGISKTEHLGMDAYGHGGFWGTVFKYIPEINTTFVVFISERDEWEIYNIAIDKAIQVILDQKESIN